MFLHCTLAFIEINVQYDQNAPALAFSTKPINMRGSVLNDGYLIFFSPSLWYSNRNWIVQLGFSTPIAQQWANTKETVDYYTSLTLIYPLKIAELNSLSLHLLRDSHSAYYSQDLKCSTLIISQQSSLDE